MFVFGIGVFGPLDAEAAVFDRPEGFNGTVDLVGEAGRLLKLLTVGVTGVLDGRSMGTVKLLNEVRGDADDSPVQESFATDLLDSLLLGPVGTEGGLKPGSSSSSSIDGNACVKPERSKLFSCGDDEGDEDGDGGPKVEGETRVWGDGADDIGVEGTNVG